MKKNTGFNFTLLGRVALAIDCDRQRTRILSIAIVGILLPILFLASSCRLRDSITTVRGYIQILVPLDKILVRYNTVVATEG